MAADHLIENKEAFKASVANALPFAESGKLVTFGIVPTSPETGYGYIKSGIQDGSAYSVNEFVEKPDLVTAKEYLASKNYYWNSGMFLFKASRYLEELKLYSPEILDVCCRAIAKPRRIWSLYALTRQFLKLVLMTLLIML